VLRTTVATRAPHDGRHACSARRSICVHLEENVARAAITLSDPEFDALSDAAE
jgi:hypothetical protein